MKPTDIDFREVVKDPSWDESALRNHICICEGQIMELWKARTYGR